MDRTRGMSLSREEKANLHNEELRKRANGFKIRLLDDPTRADEILATLDNEPESDRQLLHSLIWAAMVENLPADDQLLKYLGIMEKLPTGQARAATLHELRTSFKSRLKTGTEERKKIIAREKKKLASVGISGSAVLPKIPKGTGMEQVFEQELEGFRKKLMPDDSKAGDQNT